MAKPGRKPKPTHLKIVTGNPGLRPLPKNEPQLPPDLPPMPDHLHGEAVAEWKRVSVDLYNAGILTKIDRAALAAYCQSYGRWHKAESAILEMEKVDTKTGGLMIKTTNGNVIQNPLVGTANKAMADLVKYSEQFGMTPSARSRIDVERKDNQADSTSKFFDD